MNTSTKYITVNEKHFYLWYLFCVQYKVFYYTPAPRKGRGGGGYTVLPLSVQDIFRHIFLSNYRWQKSDIWSQASYRYAISWEAFLDPSDSYFLFADFVDFYTHWTYMLIFVAFFSANIDGRNLIFRHKLHIGTPFCGKRFLTRQILTSCLPTSLAFIHI
jgi:hypothetical protein